MTIPALYDEGRVVEAADDDPEAVCDGAIETGATRVCVMCGADLRGHRADALTCGPPCRVERNRFLRILSGQSPGPYYSSPSA